MPVILRCKNYTFFFYSNEGNPPEARHIHVRSVGKEAKLWITPVDIAHVRGFSPRETRDIIALTHIYQHVFEGAWNDYFA